MKTIWLKRGLWIIAGAAGGFAWYFFVGCTTGSCPISSNPYVSTAYGALVGVIASAGRNGSRSKE